MRLVCLHAATVDALKRLNVRLDDVTPTGLWSSEYHLVGLTPDQLDALSIFQIEAEDVTPAQLNNATAERTQPVPAEGAERAPAADRAVPKQGATAPADSIPTTAAWAEAPAPASDASAGEPARSASGESEVPLEQTRDASARTGDGRGESKPNGKATQPTPQVSASKTPASQPQANHSQSGQKAGKGSPQPVAQAPGSRKGQSVQTQSASTSGQRYGTTRLRISVAGKYTEATVANGKIIVAGRSFDSPDQAAAELTKSRGDWTFWEYYDSTDGKWRMLTRDWDSVLKSAAPGGR